MLNQDSLSQLKNLKSQMESEKERAEAVIKGTQARYGFAVLDDGREIFIPPQEMLKAFPQDRVRVCIRPTRDNKTVADIERLVDSPLSEFTGRCVRKGKALFVEPDLTQLSRWLFIPPHARNGVKEGDYVSAAVLRHPIRDGKPQAKILAVVGSDGTPGIENAYAMAKHQLPTQWNGASKKELEQILKAHQPTDDDGRRDLTDLEFVSIDAAKTQDIDDALYAEISEGGWNLYVAIADPTSVLTPGSKLQEEVAARGVSVYFHGDLIPMLPEQLSQDTCALSEGNDRPALVCKVAIADSGEVGDFEFFEARMRSRAKLAYYAVDRYLNGQYDDLMSHATPLEALYQVYRALRTHREEHDLVMDERQEFRWVLNDEKQIESIEPHEKLLSQRLVEECMVAANRCAARFLARNEASGPYVVHPGFRRDRLEELQKFLTMHAPDLAQEDPTGLAGYRSIMRGLSTPDRALPLRAMINRFLTRAELSNTPSEHMGMSLEAYTNCTSPLRKYTDFLVHMQIKSLLRGDSCQDISSEQLQQLAQRLRACRAATMEAERWLAANYLNRLAAEPGRTFSGKISYVNSSGFQVRLTENGLEGNVDLRAEEEKFSYDKWTSSLTSTTRRFQLEQLVELSYLGASAEDQWQAKFALQPGCGLKPPKEDKPQEDQVKEETSRESVESQGTAEIGDEIDAESNAG